MEVGHACDHYRVGQTPSLVAAKLSLEEYYQMSFGLYLLGLSS
jgi:hypothetical protein